MTGHAEGYRGLWTDKTAPGQSLRFAIQVGKITAATFSKPDQDAGRCPEPQTGKIQLTQATGAGDASRLDFQGSYLQGSQFRCTGFLEPGRYNNIKIFYAAMVHELFRSSFQIDGSSFNVNTSPIWEDIIRVGRARKTGTMVPKFADGGQFMTRRCTLFAVLLLVALPSVLYGRWIKDKVYLQTNSVGKVEFSHYVHMEKGESCGACHDDSMAFSVVEDCDACHEM